MEALDHIEIPAVSEEMQQQMRRTITQLMAEFAGTITRLEAMQALEEVTLLYLYELQIDHLEGEPLLLIPYGELRQRAFALLCTKRADAIATT